MRTHPCAFELPRSSSLASSPLFPTLKAPAVLRLACKDALFVPPLLRRIRALLLFAGVAQANTPWQAPSIACPFDSKVIPPESWLAQPFP